MASMIEEACREIFKVTLEVVNPLKRVVKRTECKVHKFINHQSTNILGNDGNVNAQAFFNKHLWYLNSGVVWADQDFRSSNHFYNPYIKKGLYGFSDAMRECNAYYAAALFWWRRNDSTKAIFCLGAACHLIQDMTVPQHVSLDLLNNHKNFENWVIRTHNKVKSFKCSNDGIYLNSVEDFINGNAYVALDACGKSRGIINLNDRFLYITSKVLCQAQRSTAGLLQLFYDSVQHEEGS